MPKRRHHDDESREERWQRKLRKYESKLKKRRYGVIYSDEDVPFQGNRELVEDEYFDEDWNPAPPEDLLDATPNEPSIPTSVAHESNDPAVDPCDPAPIEPTADPTSPAQNVSAIPVEGVVELNIDQELLNALGASETETTEWGESIFEEIAKRVNPPLLNGLSKEARESILKKYTIPKNVPLAKAPTLNAEISAMLTDPSRNRDKRIYNKQNQLGTAISAVTKAMSLLLCKDPKIADVLGILTDAAKILADSHYSETDTRRSLIIPLVDKGLTDPFKNRKRDGFLFGDNLGDLVKNSRGIKKTGQLIQATPLSSNLNSRGQLPRSRNRQRSYANRGGGHQNPYAYRRRPASYAPSQTVPPRRPAPAATSRRPPATAHAPPRASAAPPATDRTAPQ